MESTILFIGEKHFAGTAAGSVIFCLRKKNSDRQNLRNATNLLSTFESSPTCLFNEYTVKIDKFMRESETFIKDLNSFNKRNSIKGNRNFYKGFQFLR